MNALDLLAARHRRLLELTQELTGGAGDPQASPKERRRAAQRLVIEGSKHEVVEEQLLWPLVRDRLEGGRYLAMAGVQQEMGARNLLHELHHVQAGNNHFTTLVFTVASHIRDHVTYEENQIWPKLRLSADEAELAHLGRQMEAAERVAPSRPHPHTPPDADWLRKVAPATGRIDRALDTLLRRG